MYNNVTKIVKIYTKDLDFIEDNSSDLYPYAVWVDEYTAVNDREIKKFLLDYLTELGLLLDGKIDYIIVEYDK